MVMPSPDPQSSKGGEPSGPLESLCPPESAHQHDSGLVIKMAEPRDLILIRHGESEGNVISRMISKGTASEELIRQYTSTPDNWLRLTKRGVEQARQLGEWWKDNMSQIDIKQFFCSYHVRAQETLGEFALAAGLDSELFRKTSLIGERDWADHNSLPVEEQQLQRKLRDANSRFWTPHNGGESLREVEGHARDFMGTMHRKYAEQGVAAFSHGEFITVLRGLEERFDETHLSAAIEEGVPNCGIVHYSRVNPDTGEMEPHLNWVRLYCPWNPEVKNGGWSGEWRRIERPQFTAEDLLDNARSHPRIFDNFPSLDVWEDSP